MAWKVHNLHARLVQFTEQIKSLIVETDFSINNFSINFLMVSNIDDNAQAYDQRLCGIKHP